MDKVVIRKLKTSDLFTVTGLLKKVAKSGLSEMIVAESKSDSKIIDSPIKIGLLVLTVLYDNVVDDLILWFASLCNVTKEEYMESDVNTTLDIIDYLSTNEDCKSFFLRASDLVKTIPGLPSTTKEK